MLRDSSPTQTDESNPDGAHSCGSSARGSTPKRSLEPAQAAPGAPTIGLANDVDLCTERCTLWQKQFQPKSLIVSHLVNELARSSLLSDQVAWYRQAELEKQARDEQYQWARKRRRRMRYLGVKIRTRPAEAVEQLQGFGEGADFLVDAFAGLINHIRIYGYFPPHETVMGLQVCGSTAEPAAIGRNPLAYTLLVNNLGCTPGVPAADIDPWLEPVRRPAAFRDRPRHELIGADPQECRMRLLAAPSRTWSAR